MEVLSKSENSRKHKSKDSQSLEKKEKKKRKLHHVTSDKEDDNNSSAQDVAQKIRLQANGSLQSPSATLSEASVVAAARNTALPTPPSTTDLKLSKKRNTTPPLSKHSQTSTNMNAIISSSLSPSSSSRIKSKSKAKKRDKTTATTANSLPSQPLSSPYTLVTASRYFPISPAYSTNPTLGIQHDHLDPLVFKYDPTLGGVVLLHQNLRFKATTAKVMYESPFAYTWVDVDFILWKPKEGMVLEGWVNNASPSHVGLLFANVFSVSVAKDGIPKGWKWVDEEEGYGNVGSGDDGGYGTTLGHWEDESGELVKDLVRFVVVAVKTDGGMLSLEGSFVGK